MEQNVTITVRGGDAGYTVRGSMAGGADGAVLLRYEEPAELGMGGVSTELTLSADRAVLRRTGAVRCELRFEAGEAHSSVYETAHGSFPATVETHFLRVRFGARGGALEARYTLTLGGAADERRLKLLARTEEKA